MEDLEKTVEEQRTEIEQLRRELENFERTSAIMKCRDCLFRTNSIVKLQEHMETLGHSDYAILLGNKVVTDWFHVEIRRKEPERAS